MLPLEVKRLVSEGLLSYVLLSPSLLIVFVDRGLYEQVMIHFDSSSEDYPSFAFHGVAVIENPFSAEAVETPLPHNALAVKHCASSLGFKVVRTSRRLELDPHAIVPKAQRSHRVELAVPDDSRAIADMLSRGFDYRCDYIPTDDELSMAIGEGRVLCVRNENGVCAAFLHYDSGQITELRHLYVAKELRSQGVATSLLDEYLTVGCSQARRAVLWVRDGNDAAIALYESFGYRFQGRRSEEYARKD